MQIIFVGDTESPIRLATVDIKINGKIKSIVPVRTKFSMNPIVSKVEGIAAAISDEDILPSTICFTKPDAFIKEGIELIQLTGEALPKDLPSDAPEVLVYLDKADNVQLLGVRDLTVHNSVIIDCIGVADAYDKVAKTAYLSQVPTKNEWLGLAATKDNTLNTILDFANKHGMAGTATQGYFGLDMKVSLLQSQAIVKTKAIELQRTEEQATTLLDAVVTAFGARNARQTRYVKAINWCINEYGFDLTISALRNVSLTEKIHIDSMGCDKKISCLQGLLIEHIAQLKIKQESN